MRTAPDDPGGHLFGMPLEVAHGVRFGSREEGNAEEVKLVAVNWRNSTVDGRYWPKAKFAELDLASPQLVTDNGSWPEGCIKYVETPADEAGHRVRSRYPKAEAVKVDGVWMWRRA